MRQYLDLLEDVLNNGSRQANRTGIDALSVPGAMLKFDLANGFPAVTTKKLQFAMVAAELVGFLRGYDNAADFRALGCPIWDQNANENEQWLRNPNRLGTDDLGRIYGVQWRRWRAEDDREIDQLMHVLETIRTRPTDRRMIISAWRPDEIDQMALPPCHVLYQFLANVERRELSLCMYQRSCDLFLGVPFNIASSALLLSLVAKITDFTPRFFTHFLADAHIYTSHVSQVKVQLQREPLPLPELEISVASCDQKHLDPTFVDRIEPRNFRLIGYRHHPAIKAPMAV